MERKVWPHMIPRTTVCQLGARMHYAVPRLLHAENALELFYTDICAQRGWPRLLGLIPHSLQPDAARRLAGRIVRDVPRQRIRAFTNFGLAYARRQAAARTPQEMNAVFLWGGKKFCELVIERGLGAAEMIYTFNSAGLELQQHARKHGVKTIVEQTIAPVEIEAQWIAREHAKHPGWEPPLSSNHAASELSAREKSEWENADLILCASEFVRDGIAKCGGPVARCCVVPYGIDATFAATPRVERDEPLRVLTVGAVGLRKGSPYVLAAARELAGKVHFRMVGATPICADALTELSAHVEICGAVPRSEIGRHFAWADVFLLPSLCEGSATATYEAMACGLPVIATLNTGSVVRDGLDGFIVPAADADAIVEKLSLLNRDRNLLKTLSENARERAREFTLEAYGKRLCKSLASL